MFEPSDIVPVPATPLQIPCVEIQFPMPLQWVNFITSRGLDIPYMVEDFVTWHAGLISPNLTLDFPDLVRRMEERYALGISQDMEGKTVVVRQTIRRAVWDVLELGAANTNRTIHALILLALASNMAYADELAAALKAMREEDEIRSASIPAAPGKVIPF